MKRRILMVSDDVSNLGTWKPVLQRNGYEVLQAVLDKKDANDKHPHWPDVLRQCKESGITLDGVLLYDASVPSDDPGLKFFHEHWKEMDGQLKNLDAEAERLKPRIDVDSGDPIADSNKLASLQSGFDRAYAEGVEEVRGKIAERKGAAEFFLTTNPPSQRGLNFLAELRKEDSPYKDTVVVVEFAHPGKKETFLRAGATIVNSTSDSWDVGGDDLLLKELAKRGLAPKKPGADVISQGAKTPLDQAREPRGGRGQDDLPS